MRLRLRTVVFIFFFFNDTATTEIYTLSLHDALPIFFSDEPKIETSGPDVLAFYVPYHFPRWPWGIYIRESGLVYLECRRSEEHTSELQSRSDLVCRLLLEKKNTTNPHSNPSKRHHPI